MALGIRKNKAKLKAFTLIENMVAVTLILLVFVGASYAFLKFSMLPKWQEQLKAQSLIEQDYSLINTEKLAEGTAEEQTDNYHLHRKTDRQAERLFLVNYKVSRDDRIISEKNYYYLESE
jgi:uncharacterized protein YpmB